MNMLERANHLTQNTVRGYSIQSNMRQLYILGDNKFMRFLPRFKNSPSSSVRRLVLRYSHLVAPYLAVNIALEMARTEDDPYVAETIAEIIMMSQFSSESDKEEIKTTASRATMAAIETIDFPEEEDEIWF